MTLTGSYRKGTKPESLSSPGTYPPHRKEIYDRVTAQLLSPTYKRTIPAPSDGAVPNLGHEHSAQAQNPAMSFVEITESQIVPPQATIEHLTEGHIADGAGGKQSSTWDIDRSERLFSILSSHSDIDHPICIECTSLLLSSFNARLSAATRERDAYISFLKDLQAKAQSDSTPEQIAAEEKELAKILDEEKAALTELEALEEQKRLLEAEIDDLEDEGKALQKEEEGFWKSRNAFDEEMHELTTNLASLQEKYSHDQQQLDRLQRTNVFNDTFCIGHDGFFVTINGLRLGRLPNQHVEWAEINAAWGQTLLLLTTVAERLDFEFNGYRLKPLGSTSRIEKVEWPQQAPSAQQSSRPSNVRQLGPPKPTPKITALDLFSGGDIALGRMFYHRRFDAGMVAFLECLSQLGDYVEKISAPKPGDKRPGLPRSPPSAYSAARNKVLPYPINGDKIGDPATGQAVSIKLGAGFQQDENWTKACKYALTCCKFLLAYVSNISNTRESDR